MGIKKKKKKLDFFMLHLISLFQLKSRQELFGKRLSLASDATSALFGSHA